MVRHFGWSFDAGFNRPPPQDSTEPYFLSRKLPDNDVLMNVLLACLFVTAFFMNIILLMNPIHIVPIKTSTFNKIANMKQEKSCQCSILPSVINSVNSGGLDSRLQQ